MAIPTSARELPLWLRPSAVFLICALLLAARFYVAGATGLVRDEGYYTLWSMYPSLGYLDHPPMIAWLIGLGRMLLGESELAIRLWPVIATGIVSFAVYRTGQLLFDARTAAIGVIWYNLTIVGGLMFIAAPDGPVVLFWALAIWCVAEFVAHRNPNWWLAAGIFVGLGLLSKYTMAFLGVGLLLYIFASSERRAWLKHWQVWAGGVLSILVFLPNLIWNAQNEWASVAFQGRRLSNFGHSFGSFGNNLLDLVAGQALATGIFLFIFVVISFVLLFTRREMPGRANLTLPILTSLPLLIYFVAYTMRFRAEANWLAPVWPMLSLVGAWTAVHLRPVNRLLDLPLAAGRWLQAPVTLTLLALVYAQALWQPFELPQAIDRTRDMRGWVGLRSEVETFARDSSAAWIATAGDYGLTGQLAAYGAMAKSSLPIMSVDGGRRWDFLPRLTPEALSRRGLFVQRARIRSDIVARYFATYELIGEARRMQGEEELERFHVYVVSVPLTLDGN
jgi:4-amino-4-deoxy-L-arabinose transferase-like glycosyltransferase